MNTAKQVDEELAKLWPQRGETRGIPQWEQRIAKKAIEELLEAGEKPKLLEIGPVCDKWRESTVKDLLKI